ncbi:MAG: lysophospholipid acyltransferase family protein [Microcoleaceae cyanobacterium]
MTQSEVSPWLTPITYFLLGRIILPLYFGRIYIQGQENLPSSGAMILAPTHRSRWDPILLGYGAGRQVTGRDLWYAVLADQTIGLQGWFVRRLGGFPIDRDRPTTASIRRSVELLQNQKTLVLFPEGHIFLDNEIHPIQPGVARIALYAATDESSLDLSVVPVSIRYEHPAPLPWRCGVRVKFGSPLRIKDYQGGSTKQAAKKLTADLESALKVLHQSPYEKV